MGPLWSFHGGSNGQHWYPLKMHWITSRHTLYLHLFATLVHSDTQDVAKVLGCLAARNVPFQTSISPSWTTLISPYNLRLFWEPAVVTIPTSAQGVADSVACAAVAGGNIKVQAKSGGHSYASYSNGGVNGSMIVNLQRLQSVGLDNGQSSSPIYYLPLMHLGRY